MDCFVCLRHEIVVVEVSLVAHASTTIHEPRKSSGKSVHSAFRKKKKIRRSKNTELRSKRIGKNDEFCIQNVEFCISK